MKYCPFCGVGLQDNMLFCPACGKRFQNASVGVEEQTESIEEKEVAEDAFPPIEHTDLSQNKAKKKAKGWVFAGVAAIIALFAVVLIFFPGKNTVEELCNSVLYLELYDDFDSMIGSASGFIIQDGKTLVTNYHVIDGTYHIVAKTADGKESTVADTVLAYDEKLDLAILECEKDLGVLPIPLGDSDRVKQGDKVYAIGYPLGLANTLSDGVISSVYNDNGIDTIQTTAAISHGSSGGVLLNKQSEAIGVTAAYYEDGQNLNLAIPINYVKELNKNESKQLKELYVPSIETHSVDEILANFDSFVGKDVYIEGWASLHNCTDFAVWINVFGKKEDTHIQNGPWISEIPDNIYSQELEQVKAYKGMQARITVETPDEVIEQCMAACKNIQGGDHVCFGGTVVDFLESPTLIISYVTILKSEI